MKEFKSKMESHALQREEKIDIMFDMLIEIMEKDYCKELKEVEKGWKGEVADE